MALQRRAPEPGAARPALRRVERPLPEPGPAAPDDLEAGEPLAAEPAPARGLLRRVADAFRGGPPPAPRAAPPPSPRAAAARPTVARTTPAPPPPGSRPRMSVRDGEPPAPVASTPAVAGFPQAIARAGLGVLDEHEGSSTVTFPSPGGGIPPYVPFSTTPMTVSRAPLDEIGAAATDVAQAAVSDAGTAVAQGAGAAAEAATSAVTGAASSGAGDADKQFEELYDRLKRELLIEQEQLSQLFHEQ